MLKSFKSNFKEEEGGWGGAKEEGGAKVKE